MPRLTTSSQKSRHLVSRLVVVAAAGAALASVLSGCVLSTPTPATPNITVVRPLVTPTVATIRTHTVPERTAAPPSSSGTSNAAAQEETWMSQQPTPGEIFAEPACDDSYNGCAP